MLALTDVDGFSTLIDNRQSTGGKTVSRVQLALNVADLEASIAFYSKLFNSEPAKIRPGYANFAISEPPLKLVLIEQAAARGAGAEGALNHLGVEVGSSEAVADATSRLSGEGLPTRVEESTTCCYAVQDKVWVDDPDGAPWEVYTVLADAPVSPELKSDAMCCSTSDKVEPKALTSPSVGCC
jgi:catechol 2,3-dioxygenase-like lactoylglutathione lyase family enzyme